MTTHNKDKIIAATKEAGIQVIFDAKFGRDDYQSIFSSFPALERFYAIAFEDGRQTEREECAKVCDFQKIKNTNLFPYDPSLSIAANECAEAIRTRGTK